VKLLADYNSIKEYLRNTLSAKRYLHSENTALTAEKLAKIYNIDSQKAYTAGLVHDCTREIEIKIQQNMLVALGIQVDELTYNNKELLHAHTAESIIRDKFRIIDEEIISAVRFHTTGKEDMTLFEKVLFLSDVVEPTRNFPGVDYLRQLSIEDVDEALLAAFDSSIKFLMGKRSLIHTNTFLARNYILKHFKE
jgi:predicted HD superfamily hydrolase involved in NAD metabolism